MAEYFGFQIGAASRSNTNQMFWASSGYTCPGSGTMNLLSLGLEGGDTNGTWHIGIYDDEDNLVCSSTSAKSNIDGWLEWSAAELTGTKTLTGGGTYYLAIYGMSGPNIMLAASGTTYYDAADYSGGMPASLPAPDDADGQTLNIRGEVEEPGGSSILPLVMNMMRRHRV